MESQDSGMIFNIQRFSTEDGPGIRTTVFMKGCPLHCLWCHNVEGINPKPEIVWHDTKCIGCLSCVGVCPNQAIQQTPSGLVTDRRRCNACGKCAEACPAKSRELVGKVVSVEAVFAEVLKDRVFYETSGGGVTASGGEPTQQPEFVTGLFSKCRSSDMHTALDTCGHVKWETLERILKFTDLVLYDLKEINSKRHEGHTGVKPTLIWENARRIAKLGKKMWVRTPIVPGYTDSVENIRGIAELCAELGNVERLDLLPYHRLGEPKYRKLGLEYRLRGLQPPTREKMEKLKGVAREYRLKIVT
ncbi:MAG: glycyl-radical enzyme activating protein [Promethearchaeati archaeon SRVP18_Atabeyarchaeia-1]